MKNIVALVTLWVAVAAFGAETVWIKDGQIVHRPTILGKDTLHPTDTQLNAAGYYQTSTPECERKYWVIESQMIREMTADEKEQLDQQELARHLAEYQARVAAISQELWFTASKYRKCLRKHFPENPSPETDRSVTRAAVFVLIADLLDSGTGAEDAIILQTGYDTISAWTGDGTTWSFPWNLLPQTGGMLQ